jgi:phage pi2 protein 07
MVITIDERKNSNKVVFFMKSETIEDAALLLRMAGSMKNNNDGWVNYSDNSINGWIAVPLMINRKTTIKSGKKF